MAAFNRPLEQIPIMLNHILRPRSSLCILPA